MRIAIVGATGLVGTIILEELASGDFDIEIEKIVPMASHRSAGSSVEFSGEEVEIIPLDSGNIPPVDIAFFAVEDALSKKFAPIFVQRGATVIDKSNAFRRDEKVPLVVPEVNGSEIGDAKIIASLPPTNVMQSSFAPMLAMIGGSDALMSIKEPFVIKIKEILLDMTRNDLVQENIKAMIQQSTEIDKIISNIEIIVEKRLDELTPQMVKDIIQEMIRKHLGWLVVWGGVFGGIIGLGTSLIN